MFEFGSGTIYGNPISGNAAGNPTPMKFGTLQNVSVDISGDLKELYGQKQFPEAVARGKMKITGKAQYAHINGKQLNDFFFGQTMAAGMIKTSVDQAATVTAGAATPPPPSGTYLNDVNRGDLGVIYQATGLPLTKVASAPSVGQYAVNVATGAYTFNVGDNNAVVLISYRYTPTTTGSRATITNQLMGFAPTLLLTLNNTYNGLEDTLTLYSVVASKLTWATKQEDFIIPEFDFSAFANAAGQVIDFDFSE